MTKGLKIGTRGSPLALAQAEAVKAELLDHFQIPAIEIVVIKTSGDIIQDRLLIEEGGKGLFTKEIEEQLLDGSIDLAVHSTKDIPAVLPDGLEISAFLEREDPRDAFLSHKAKTLSDLSPGAVVGTSSLRRQAQVLQKRPDLKVVPFRGNVETRLKKMVGGEVDATLLAVAGLNRLGLSNKITSILSLEDMIPAPGQGAVAIETRAADDIKAMMDAITHTPTSAAIAVERSVSLALGASCRMPLGAIAEIHGDSLSAKAALFSPDGKKVWHEEMSGPLSDPTGLGRALGEAIMGKADKTILQEYRII